MKDKLMWLVILLFVLSIFGNVYFWFNPKTKIVEKPIEVIRIVTKWIVVHDTVIRPSGEAEAILARLEKATPILETDPITITESPNNIIEVSKTIKGRLQLDYLKYNIEGNLSSNISKQNAFNLRAGFFLLPAADKLVPDICLILPINVWGLNSLGLSCGLGIYDINISKDWHIWSRTYFHTGLAWLYTGQVSSVFGLSVEL